VRRGRIRAALDVTDPEPLPAGHPLWSLPGVLVAPHVGGASSECPSSYTCSSFGTKQYAGGQEIGGCS